MDGSKKTVILWELLVDTRRGSYREIAVLSSYANIQIKDYTSKVGFHGQNCIYEDEVGDDPWSKVA